MCVDAEAPDAAQADSTYPYDGLVELAKLHLSNFALQSALRCFNLSRTQDGCLMEDTYHGVGSRFYTRPPYT